MTTVHRLHIDWARTWCQRARGLLGRPAPEHGKALGLQPCASIHTVGMAYPIDVVFVDQAGYVLKLYLGLSPWRMAACLSAKAVLELCEGQIAALGIRPGHRIEPLEPGLLGARSEHRIPTTDPL